MKLTKLKSSIVFLSDLDTNVLVGTNKLVLPIAGNNIVIPIKASATNLPMEDNSISEVTCFGINNVIEIKNIGFKLSKKEILFDGPVEKVPLDLIPRENGERFQDVGVILLKE